jgi:hypothetical protein
MAYDFKLQAIIAGVCYIKLAIFFGRRKEEAKKNNRRQRKIKRKARSFCLWL